MEFPPEIVNLIHKYDRPLLRVDLVRKYREGEAILGEWPMVEACLHTNRADEVITLFDSLAKAKEALDKAEEDQLCITRRTHPVARIRWDAESKANDVRFVCQKKYDDLLLAMRILLVGEAAVAEEEARMNEFHDLCEHELDYMNEPGYMD
jgi:hypothetical protein